MSTVKDAYYAGVGDGLDCNGMSKEACTGLAIGFVCFLVVTIGTTFWICWCYSNRTPEGAWFCNMEPQRLKDKEIQE